MIESGKPLGSSYLPIGLWPSVAKTRLRGFSGPARPSLRADVGRPLGRTKTRPEGGFRAGWYRSAIRYQIMGDAAVDSPARSHKRIVDNLTHAAPAGSPGRREAS